MTGSFQFRKSLGQNFLHDKNIINKIMESFNSTEKSLIIEVGPGAGFLTKELIKKNCNVLCFEIDKRLKDFLSEIKASNLEIVYEDFLKINLKEYLSKYKYDKLFFVANLPYYITTPIINKILEETDVNEMILMIQKEVGDRFTAKPNTKQYNSLSVFLQYNFDIKKVTLVSKNSFNPVPKVDSVVMKFVKTNKYKVKDEEKFYKLVRDSFKYKRKNLKNNLLSYDIKKLEEILKIIGKDLRSRAESISIEEFIFISNKLL